MLHTLLITSSSSLFISCSRPFYSVFVLWLFASQTSNFNLFISALLLPFCHILLHLSPSLFSLSRSFLLFASPSFLLLLLFFSFFSSSFSSSPSSLLPRFFFFFFSVTFLIDVDLFVDFKGKFNKICFIVFSEFLREENGSSYLLDCHYHPCQSNKL